MQHFVGVDVGTASVRAAVFDSQGNVQGVSVSPIKILEVGLEQYEQSSDGIWQSCISAVKAAVNSSKVPINSIKGIGFDATCSLVVLDTKYEKLNIKAGNVIMWMDHRSVDQASNLTKTEHPILQITGSISPEMSIAKVLWLYENFAEYKSIGYLMELPDFLTFKATGSDKRSLNSLVCKWAFHPEKLWQKDFLLKAGVAENDMDTLLNKCGGVLDGKLHATNAGIPVGNLSKKAALAFGLEEGIVVGSGLIDAYAGAVGTLAISEKSTPEQLSNRIAIICGTSSCHITVSKSPTLVKGVWGPYPNILLDGYYCNEGGQSLTGKAIEAVIAYHPLFPAFKEKAEKSNDPIFELLNIGVAELTRERKLNFSAELTQNFHVFPELHGNRSPLADPLLRGMISGLQVPLKNPSKLPSPTLVLFYYATLLGLCYGTRSIIEALSKSNIEIKELVLSGALASNKLWAQSLADVTRCRVLVGTCLSDQAVLLGSAISAAAAYRNDGLWNCMMEMSSVGSVYEPCLDPKLQNFHQKKYNVYQKMINDQYEYRQIMK